MDGLRSDKVSGSFAHDFVDSHDWRFSRFEPAGLFDRNAGVRAIDVKLLNGVLAVYRKSAIHGLACTLRFK